jgi:hypothetical protein
MFHVVYYLSKILYLFSIFPKSVVRTAQHSHLAYQLNIWWIIQVKKVPSIQFAILCLFLFLNPNVYLISDTLNLRTCFSPLSVSKIKGKKLVECIVTITPSYVDVRSANYMHVGTYPFHAEKQMSCWKPNVEVYESWGCSKTEAVQNQICRNVHRQAWTNDVICEIAITNRHNKTQEQTILQRLFCRQKNSTNFRRSDGWYRKDINFVISYIYTDFQAI